MHALPIPIVSRDSPMSFRKVASNFGTALPTFLISVANELRSEGFPGGTSG